MVLGDWDKQLVVLFGVANEGIFHPDTFDFQESDISAKISCIGVNTILESLATPFLVCIFDIK